MCNVCCLFLFVCLFVLFVCLGSDAKRTCPSASTAPVTGLLVMKNEVRESSFTLES